MPGQYQCGFLSPPVVGVSCLNSFCNRCFLGCFPPFTGTFLDICFVLVFHSGWTSLPIAIVGLFALGFLGVCLV